MMYAHGSKACAHSSERIFGMMRWLAGWHSCLDHSRYLGTLHFLLALRIMIVFYHATISGLVYRVLTLIHPVLGRANQKKIIVLCLPRDTLVEVDLL